MMQILIYFALDRVLPFANYRIIHQGGKAAVHHGNIHVVKQQDVSLFVDPSASSELVAVDLMIEWANDKATLDVWSQCLTII
jgi:hypothetical protein